MRKSIRVATNTPYRDSAPEYRFLENSINDLIKEGYVMYGSPFVTKEGEIHQMMIKDVSRFT